MPARFEHGVVRGARVALAEDEDIAGEIEGLVDFGDEGEAAERGREVVVPVRVVDLAGALSERIQIKQRDRTGHRRDGGGRRGPGLLCVFFKLRGAHVWIRAVRVRGGSRGPG